MHHPLPIAKQVATLQCLSNGRVIFGIGAGWLEAEFAALGVPFRERGRRTDEAIAMLRALWHDDPVSFKPKYVAAEIADMRMLPLPPAPIPIWVGGSSERALARAVKLCDGWHGSRFSPDKAAPVIRALRAQRPEAGFAISLRTAWDGKDAGELRERLSAYRDAGAGHIMVQPEEREVDDWLRSGEKIARAGEGFVN
jgi:alkanesulfonate monooxygenase SsuD/methylene tetrahydromethanopterin reductase-like flavin-dependent oxidoreductase (luciferase family)